MPKYWVKNYFAHGSFPEVGQKQKTERKKRGEKDWTMVITMAKLRMAHASMHGARKPPGPKTYSLSWVKMWGPIKNQLPCFVCFLQPASSCACLVRSNPTPWIIVQLGLNFNGQPYRKVLIGLGRSVTLNLVYPPPHTHHKLARPKLQWPAL